MTEREKVLDLKSTIETVSPLLQAHIAKVNSDPNGLGNNFEDCATHLMIANPVVVKKSKLNKRVNVAAAAFIGKCPDTGVEYRFHSDEEFKALTRAQKRAFFEYRKTAEGKAAFEASRKEFKKRKASDNSNDKIKRSNKKQKRFEKKALKKAKSIILSAVTEVEEEAAERARNAAAFAQAASAFQAQGNVDANASSATAPPAVGGENLPPPPTTQPDGALAKLSSIMERVKLKGGKKKVTFQR